MSLNISNKIDIKNIKNIGFDIDDIVLDFVGQFLIYYNNKYQTNYIKDDIETWNISKHLNIDFKDFVKEIELSNIYLEGSICKNFLNKYNKLKQEGHNIFFISSRLDIKVIELIKDVKLMELRKYNNKNIKKNIEFKSNFNNNSNNNSNNQINYLNVIEATKKWLNSYGINDPIHITHEKHLIIKENNIEIFIDDSLKNLYNIHNFFKESNIKSPKLFLLKKPWNGKKEIERLKEELFLNKNFKQKDKNKMVMKNSDSFNIFFNNFLKSISIIKNINEFNQNLDVDNLNNRIKIKKNKSI